MNGKIENKKIKKSNVLGFTLVETLVAISILSLSLLGTFTAVQNSLQSSTFAKDQITAFYLVQETMEYVRNIRDQNVLYNLNAIANSTPTRDWLYGLAGSASDPCYFGKTCTIDVPQAALTACSGGFGTCPVINEDPTTGLFGYNAAWGATHFTREIQLQQLSTHEAIITVQISWSSGRFQKTFQVSESLLNWQ